MVLKRLTFNDQTVTSKDPMGVPVGSIQKLYTNKLSDSLVVNVNSKPFSDHT